MKLRAVAVLVIVLAGAAIAAALFTRNAPAPEPEVSTPQRPVVYVPVQTTPAGPPGTEAAVATRAVPGSHPASTESPVPRATRSGSGSPATATPSAHEVTPQPVNISAAPIVVTTLAPQSASLPPIAREPADAPPQILAVSLTSQVVRVGELVSATVETSSNVASVEARVGGQSAVLEKSAVGKFQLNYRVPHVPFFLKHRTYLVQIIARNTVGQAVSTAVPITIQ